MKALAIKNEDDKRENSLQKAFNKVLDFKSSKHFKDIPSKNNVRNIQYGKVAYKPQINPWKNHNLNVNNGIFLGASLSLFLYTILLHHSIWLKDTAYKYKTISKKTNQLLYMNDLKLYAKNNGGLGGLLSTVKIFSNDMEMQLDLEKCDLNVV